MTTLRDACAGWMNFQKNLERETMRNFPEIHDQNVRLKYNNDFWERKRPLLWSSSGNSSIFEGISVPKEYCLLSLPSPANSPANSGVLVCLLLHPPHQLLRQVRLPVQVIAILKSLHSSSSWATIS